MVVVQHKFPIVQLICLFSLLVFAVLVGFSFIFKKELIKAIFKFKHRKVQSIRANKELSTCLWKRALKPGLD